MVTAGLDRRFVYPVTMLNLDWKAAASPAEVLQALSEHRLLPVAGLLAERGLLRRDLVPLAEQLAAKRVNDAAERGAVEAEVFEALSRQGVRTLVLKGALLARTVYPAPKVRFRSDLDVLVAESDAQRVRRILESMRFRAAHPLHSGLPITAESFFRPAARPVHGVDLHWQITHRSVLKERLLWPALWARRVRIDGLPDGVFGLSPGDALLHACGHYLAHFAGQFRPDQWLLDMDLLWRSMDREEHEALADIAEKVGLASMLAGGLALATERFVTPVDEELLSRLQMAGITEKPARLLKNPRFGLMEVLRNAVDEPRKQEGLQLLYRTLIPRADYMRQKYPGAPKWALPWLYVRRIWDGKRRAC